ncbi:unnamed protein product [Meloidogyne enterolobii]|uniref:Uncharacterized protein n=1 Tax=Meloidogyne enterolobii TaxID=390850 RepID=A0ACB1AES6_MELEN
MELKKRKKSVPIELLREIVCFLPLDVEFADKRISFIFDLFILKIHHRSVVSIRKIRNSFIQGLEHGIELLELLQEDVFGMDATNIQDLSAIIVTGWGGFFSFLVLILTIYFVVATFCALKIVPFSSEFSDLFDQLNAAWTTNFFHHTHNGVGEDALAGLRTSANNLITQLTDLLTNIRDVGVDILNLVNPQALQSVLDEVSAMSNLLQHFINEDEEDENVEEEEEGENVDGED